MMRIHAVPQRQGAVVERSRLLPDACLALAQLAAEVTGVSPEIVPVSRDSSPTVDGVANREVLIANRGAQLAALEAPEGPVLTIGGDCGVEVVPIGVSRYRHGPGLGVLWFDAHPDLNTPESSPSGAFHGMALRALFGQGDPEFAASPALLAGSVALIGARSFDSAERDLGLTVCDDVQAECLYLHIDLDVLDPAEFPGACYPEPDGLSIDEVAARISALTVPVIGAGITECATTDPAQLRPLVPILEALHSVFPAQG
jgi:arginase